MTGCYATRCARRRRALPGVVASSATTTSSISSARSNRCLRWRPRERFGDGDGPCGAHRAGRRRPHRVHAARADRLRGGAALLHHPDDQRRVAQHAWRSHDRARESSGRARGFQGDRADRRALGSYGRDLSPASLTRRAAARARPRRRRRPLPHQLARADGLHARDRRSGRRATIGSRRISICRLQHASDRMLRAMRRPYTLDDYARLRRSHPRPCPHASIGSDIIVGFPGRPTRISREPGRISPRRR